MRVFFFVGARPIFGIVLAEEESSRFHENSRPKKNGACLQLAVAPVQALDVIFAHEIMPISANEDTRGR